MTAQLPDKLENRHPRVKTDGLRLYGVIRGDTHAEWGWGTGPAVTTQPSPPNAARSTAL